MLPLLLNPYHDLELAAFLVHFNRRKIVANKNRGIRNKLRLLVLVWSSLMISASRFKSK